MYVMHGHDDHIDVRCAWETVPLSVALSLIMLCALLGNILVIAAIRTNHELKEQTSNIFIINLCVTDLGSALVVMGTAMHHLLLDVRQVDDLWCDIVCAANYCFIFVSMMTLAAISVERLIAIKAAMRYDVLVTRFRVKLVCACVWIQGLAFGAVPVGHRWVHYDYWEVVCAIDWQKEKTQAVHYVIVAFCVNFVLPGLIILLSYLAILREARRLRFVVASESSAEAVRLKQNQHQELKTTISLLVVIGLFFVCMTPFCVTKLIKVLVEDQHYVPAYANLTASYLGYASSMVNPLIYSIFRREFRSSFKRTLSKMHCPFFPSHNNGIRNSADSEMQHTHIPR